MPDPAAADGEVVLAAFRAAAVDGAQHAVAGVIVGTEVQEDDLGNVALVDQAVAVVVVEVGHQRGHHHLGGLGKGAAGGAGIGRVAAPDDLRGGQHLVEGQRLQPAGGLPAGALAAAGLAAHVGRAVPVVLAGAVGGAVVFVDTVAGEVGVAGTGGQVVETGAVGGTFLQGVAAATPAAGAANIVPAQAAVAETLRRAVDVGVAGDVHAQGSPLRLGLALLGGGALQVVAVVVHAAGVAALDLAVLVGRALQLLAGIDLAGVAGIGTAVAVVAVATVTVASIPGSQRPAVARPALFSRAALLVELAGDQAHSRDAALLAGTVGRGFTGRQAEPLAAGLPGLAVGVAAAGGRPTRRVRRTGGQEGNGCRQQRPGW